MKSNHKLGAILAVLGILTGLLTFYLIAQQYNLLIYLSLPSTRRMLEAWNARE